MSAMGRLLTFSLSENLGKLGANPVGLLQGNRIRELWNTFRLLSG